MTGPDEKATRRHRRMPVAYEYYLAFPGRTLGGGTREISPFGAGLFAEDKVAVGQSAELTVIVPETSFRLIAPCAVRSCVPNPERGAPERRYIIGVEFVPDRGGVMPLIARPGETASFAPSHAVSIERPAAECYRHACDFEGYLHWSSGLTDVRILQRDPEGRARLVEFVYNFYIRQARYILEYGYDDAGAALSWAKSGGDEDIVSIGGKFSFDSRGGRAATATYALDLTLAFIPSERLVTWATAILMRQELRNFKQWVESSPAPPSA